MRSSAAGSTFSEYYGLNGNIGRAIMIIASLATVLLGLNKLVQIIGYISPVLLLVTIVIGVISIASNPEGIAQADASLQTITVHTNFSNWVISGLMYGAYTVTGVVPYLADIGKSTSTNKKNSVWGGVFGGGAFILAVMMVTFIDKMQENVADTEAEIVEWYREKAESAGVTLTQDEVMDEITADFAGDMMENPDLFREFSQSNRTAAQKLLDSLKEFIAKVKSIFTGKARDVAAQEAYGKDFAELEAVAQKWQSAFDAAERQAEKTKTAAGEGDGVRYNLKNTTDKNVVSIKQQIANAAQELNAAEPVVRKTVFNIFSSMNIKQKRAWAEAEALKYGNRVDRQGYGSIEVSRKDVNSALNYLQSDGEIAAFATLPYVLKRGKEIYREADHKRRGYSTVTFAAPVVINGCGGIWRS